VTTEYFDATMVNQQRLRWTAATRQQLERWEPLVAAHVLDTWEGRTPDGPEIWRAKVEHHFALVAASHLLRALDLPPATSVPIDRTLRAELIEGRNLHEHWDENMPVFNVRPRVKKPPHQTGRDFAARNPDRGPYWWLGWNSKKGALLLPHVATPAVYDLLNAAEAEALSKDAALSRFLPPRAPSPWVCENGEWWPNAAAISAARSSRELQGLAR
jgi:hypothetical protein